MITNLRIDHSLPKRRAIQGTVALIADAARATTERRPTDQEPSLPQAAVEVTFDPGRRVRGDKR
jgi:hypothetical protein